MAKAKKNIEELYKAIFAIRDALTDAQQLAAEAAVMSDAFGGEIARVITAQINTYFIPGISKFVDDEDTPGAMSPLITFLDSVPLAMTRGEPEPQQTTPAPIANPQLSEPAGAAPVEGSYAAKTRQESRKREAEIKNQLRDRFFKGTVTPNQAVSELAEQGYSADQAKSFVQEWQSEDEALYESRSMKECYQIIRKGKKDEQIIDTLPCKEAADAKAKALNATVTPSEKNFFGTEYVVKPFKKPEGQKDVSQTKALATPKKMPESSSPGPKESLALADIPLDDYAIEDAYSELQQGGPVEDDLAPDYIAQNMFGAEPGSERYQQVSAKVRGLSAPVLDESLAMGDIGADPNMLKAKVNALVEDGFSLNDAIDYVVDTEEVDRVEVESLFE